jgi:hypothetical protein
MEAIRLRNELEVQDSLGKVGPHSLNSIGNTPLIELYEMTKDLKRSGFCKSRVAQSGWIGKGSGRSENH